MDFRRGNLDRLGLHHRIDCLLVPTFPHPAGQGGVARRAQRDLLRKTIRAVNVIVQALNAAGGRINGELEKLVPQHEALGHRLLAPAATWGRRRPVDPGKSKRWQFDHRRASFLGPSDAGNFGSPNHDVAAEAERIDHQRTGDCRLGRSRQRRGKLCDRLRKAIGIRHVVGRRRPVAARDLGKRCHCADRGPLGLATMDAGHFRERIALAGGNGLFKIWRTIFVGQEPSVLAGGKRLAEIIVERDKPAQRIGVTGDPAQIGIPGTGQAGPMCQHDRGHVIRVHGFAQSSRQLKKRLRLGCVAWQPGNRIDGAGVIPLPTNFALHAQRKSAIVERNVQRPLKTELVEDLRQRRTPVP